MAQILITGTSGIGKTTLAEYISKKYGIPFIGGSSKVLWDKYGITSHKNILEMNANNPQKAIEFQYELLNIRMEQILLNDDFVADRSFIDNVVYFLFQNSAFIDESETTKYIYTCTKMYEQIDNPSIIYLTHDIVDPYNRGKVEDDGMRISNNLFQNHVIGPIFDSVINNDLLSIGSQRQKFDADYKCPVLTVPYWKWETRVTMVTNYLGKRR